LRALLILPIPEQQVLGSNPSVGSTPAANGRVAGECSDSSDELALRERAALHDFDPSLPTVFRVIGSDLVREVADHLAVADQQQIVVERSAVSVVEVGESPGRAERFRRWTAVEPSSPRRMGAFATQGDDDPAHARHSPPTSPVRIE
jgi:hypothetical protein